MDFNTLLLRLGISSENFSNKYSEAIKIENGFLYDVEQEATERICPYCSSTETVIKGHYITETSCSENENFKDVLRIKRVRLFCKKCHKTFSPKIKGIEKYSKISKQVELFIVNDFSKPFTFSDIAKRYSITKNRVIQIFDEKIKLVPRRRIPKILCVDEIHFCEELDQKYCCVLYDFENKEIVDIIRNRKIDYLNNYFANISQKERENTRIFISDMYEGYSTICRRFFPKAVHIIDMFHIVTQVSRAVNSLRVRTMNGYSEKGDSYYNFMKTHWKYFLCRSEKVPNKIYTNMKTGEVFHYDNLIYKCITFDSDFWEGYLVLQDLFHFNFKRTYDETLSFVKHISARLLDCKSDLLKKVGETFIKWRYEIANAFTREAKELHYTNAIAECLNNQLKTIIKSAYGYHNFERFRKRAMLIITYTKRTQD